MLFLPSWQNFSIVVVLLFILMDVNFVGIFNVPKSWLSQYPGILASHTCSVTHFYGWVCFRICISQSPIICFSKLSPFLLICFCYSHRCLLYSFAVLLCTNNCCKKWLLNARTCWDGYFTLLYYSNRFNHTLLISYFVLHFSIGLGKYLPWVPQVQWDALVSATGGSCEKNIGHQYKDLTATVNCALKVSCTEWGSIKKTHMTLEKKSLYSNFTYSKEKPHK